MHNSALPLCKAVSWKICLSIEDLQSSSSLQALRLFPPDTSLGLAVFNLHLLTPQNPGLLPPGCCLCARSLAGLMLCFWISAPGRHRRAPQQGEDLYLSKSSLQQLNRKELREFKLHLHSLQADFISYLHSL